MRHFSSFLDGLTRSLLIGGRKNYGTSDGGRETADELLKEAKKNESILCTSGTVHAQGSKCCTSLYSRRGEKGVNQDCFIVWEDFGCQKDMMFYGVFDGHGPWGHFVAKSIRKSLPSSLLCNWQETVAMSSFPSEVDLESEKMVHQFNIWKQSYLRTCDAVDKELEQNRRLDCFHSGTTALTVVKQGELIVIANVGDSRAVLATTSEDGNLVPVQLTVDFKPNLPQEVERITQCKGRVFCLQDEPGVYRLWLPDGETPGLAMSRAFGDYCVKDFGLISVPEVTQRNLTSKDKFLVLATDGVWDVVSNQEAVQIVSSAPNKDKSAKQLVEYAVHAWKRKRKGIAVDDCSAICIFFDNSPPSQNELS